jgi:hypothetical protein
MMKVELLFLFVAVSCWSALERRLELLEEAGY